MANMTPQEQLMLELINRARMDPAAEAARYGISLNEGLMAGTISTAPKQVLAGNSKLALSADKHSDWIITNDVFPHNDTSGSSHYYAAGRPATRSTSARSRPATARRAHSNSSAPPRSPPIIPGRYG